MENIEKYVKERDEMLLKGSVEELKKFIAKYEEYYKPMMADALDLINRQKAEIERLEKELSTATNHITRLENQIERLLPMLKTKRAEAIKEFAERLKEKRDGGAYPYVLVNVIDNLLKELTEGGNEDGMD